MSKIGYEDLVIKVLEPEQETARGKRLPLCRWWCLALIGLFLNIFSSAVAQDNVRSDLVHVTAAVPRVFPPYYMVSKSGQPVGFAIDVMERLAVLAGLRVTYLIENSTTDMAEAVRAGRADLIPDIGISTGRETWLDYTAPINIFPISIFVRRSTHDVQGLDDLTGRRVAAVKFNIGVDLLKDRKDFDLVVFDDATVAILELLSGQVDAIVFPAQVLMKIVRDAGIDNRIKIVGKPLAEIRRAVGVRKGNLALLERLNQAVNRFVGTAEYQQIYVKWFGKPQPFWTARRVVLGMSGLLLLVFIAMAVWRYSSMVKLNRQLTKSITERKRAEEELQQVNQALKTLSECNQALVRANDETELLNDICRILVEVGGYRLAWVGFAEQDEGKTVRPVAHMGYEEGYLDTVSITWADTELGRGPVGTAIRTGRPCIVRNILTDPSFAPWQADAMKRGYVSVISLPLIADDRTFGALAIYEEEPDVFDAEEVKLLTELANDLTYGILALRTREEHERAEDEVLWQNVLLGGINKVLRETFKCETDEDVARTCLAVAEELTNSKFGFIGELNPAGLFDTIAISNPGWDVCKMPGSEATRLTKNMAISGIDRSVLRDEKSRIVNEPASHPDRVGTPEGHPPITSFLGVPLKHGDRTIGMIGLANKESGYELADQQAVESLSLAFVEVLNRNWAEKALRKSELLLTETQKMAKVGGWELDLESNRMTWTDEAYRIHEVAPDFDPHLENGLSFYAPESRPLIEQAMQRAIETGEPYDLELQFITAKGNRLWVRTIGKAHQKDRKTVKLSGTLQDITERKRTEEAIERLRRKNEMILNSTGEGIFGLDLEGNVTFVNLSATKLTGWQTEELIGKSHHDILHQYRADGTPYPKEECPVYKVSKGEVSHHAGEDVFWRKDGTSFPVEILATPVLEDGRLLGGVVSFQDITERKKLERLFIHAQKMEATGRLAGGIAHDFNNLMTVVIGNAELFLMKLGEDDPSHEHIIEIKNAGERASALTRQLLAFSRKQLLQPRVLNLNALIQETEKMLRRLIEENVELKTILASELGRVEADPTEMVQVIMNLAVNARDAMPQGGKLTIETANVDLDETYGRQHGVELKPGPYVMLVVSDTGIGMDEQTQWHIFEPFFTTKEKDKGTGLGLATVYGIVKQSGGFIWVYSEPGQGTTFKIYLPSVEAEAKPLSEARVLTERLTGSETILLVEDDDSVRNLARRVLQRCGYRVLEGQGAEEALRVSKQHEGTIHLVLTDVVMPGMSGTELAEKLQSERPETKVIYMSGYMDNAIVHHGILEPGTKFIHKPFTPDSLARKVREALDEK